MFPIKDYIKCCYFQNALPVLQSLITINIHINRSVWKLLCWHVVALKVQHHLSPYWLSLSSLYNFLLSIAATDSRLPWQCHRAEVSALAITLQSQLVQTSHNMDIFSFKTCQFALDGTWSKHFTSWPVEISLSKECIGTITILSWSL